MKILWVSMLLSAALGSVLFREDQSKIQAKRITVFSDSTNAMNMTGGLVISQTFSRTFTNTPGLFFTICSFNIANTQIINYELKNTGYSKTDANFSVQVGEQTLIYQIALNYIAFDLPSLLRGTISFQSKANSCSGRTTFNQCNELYNGVLRTNHNVFQNCANNMFFLTNSLTQITQYILEPQSLTPNMVLSIVILTNLIIFLVSNIVIIIYAFVLRIISFKKNTVVNKYRVRNHPKIVKRTSRRVIGTRLTTLIN